MKKLLITIQITILIFLMIFLFLPGITKAQNAWTDNTSYCRLVSIPGVCNPNETEDTNSPSQCEQAGTHDAGLCCCYNIPISTQTINANNTPNYDPLVFTPQVQIPISGSSFNQTSTPVGTYSDGVMTSDLLAKYIKALYDYGLMIGGILAAIVLMGGGILWLVSAGNDTKISQAKELIGGSVTGLVILFSSWILLTAVNPELVQNKVIKTTSIEKSTYAVGCCLDKTTSKVSNTTPAECKDNTFEANKLANTETNTCEITGCCFDAWYSGQNSGEYCIQSIKTDCKNQSYPGSGDVKTFYSNTYCSTIPKCNNITKPLTSN